MNIFGQTRYFHRFPSGRFTGKIGAVDRVDGREVIHVLEKDGGLDDVPIVELRGGENLAQIFHHLVRFFFDGGGEQLARRLLDSDLPGNKQHISGLDRLAVRANGGGSIGTEDDIFCHEVRVLLLIKYQHFNVQLPRRIMKILVIGNAEQQAECRAKFGPGHQFQDCTSWEEAGSLVAAVQVVFDFTSANSDQVLPIPSELQADLFVDTSQFRLTDWLKRYGVSRQRIYGFCGLRTFLAREVLEVTLAQDGEVQDLEKVCAALGTSFQVVADQAGMVSPRVIGMIINEAFYTVEEGTATKEDIDLAMKLGTNYPYGPFEWAERIGLKNLVATLDAVYRETNDERYRICPLLIEQARLS